MQLHVNITLHNDLNDLAICDKFKFDGVALPAATPSRFDCPSFLGGQICFAHGATHHHIIPTFNVNIPNDIFGFQVFPPLAVLKALLFNFVNCVMVQ